MSSRSSTAGPAVSTRTDFDRWCVAPTRRIVERLRIAAPGAGSSAFPRAPACGSSAIIESTGVDASRDRLDGAAGSMRGSSCSRMWRCRETSIRSRLVAGGAALDREIDRILDRLAGGRFIFNLGHGILPGDADRQCRAAGRDGSARQESSHERTGSVAAYHLVQGVPHHRGDRLDGGDALPAAAVRLSRRRRHPARHSPRRSR